MHAFINMTQRKRQNDIVNTLFPYPLLHSENEKDTLVMPFSTLSCELFNPLFMDLYGRWRFLFSTYLNLTWISNTFSFWNVLPSNCQTTLFCSIKGFLRLTSAPPALLCLPYPETCLCPSSLTFIFFSSPFSYFPSLLLPFRLLLPTLRMKWLLLSRRSDSLKKNVTLLDMAFQQITVVLHMNHAFHN